MKFNPTLMALGVLVGAGVIVGAYQLGQQGSSEAINKNEAAVLTQTAQPVAAVADMASPDAASVDGPRFSHFRVGNRNVKSIFADGRYVWVGTSGGVIRYDTELDDYELFNNKNAGLLSNGIFHVSRLDDRRMAIGTYGGGLAVFDVEANTWQTINIPDGLADQFVYDVLTVANGDVWIATWSGANRVRNGEFDNPDAWETFTVENTNGGLPNPWVYGVEAGLNGDVWFATEGGLALYKDGKWQKWGHDEGLGADYELVESAIQFKSDPGQASMHHARQKDEQGLQDVKVAYNPNYVISLQVQKDGTVWAGTWGAGLGRFKDGEWKNYTSFDGLPANHIFMLYLDPQENLWAGTSKGLARFDPDTETFSIKTMNDGLYAENVFSMTTGKDGDFWIGSFGGVAHIEQGWSQ
ncbi:MAG TPA: regulator [Candidatus Tenderia electrophaga]|uniref:Regulator n=1 Tax=Candidatus Tenderia electrophaga TaxID=1748243 RepID=A0A832J524_9GAMM|nr:regulator [Candidatus Tenderia electrophaga]